MVNIPELVVPLSVLRITQYYRVTQRRYFSQSLGLTSLSLSLPQHLGSCNQRCHQADITAF